ncbi:MAG: G5 domain-containing protein, partial [Oscillospiraceae bacterium]|nr:G5 domain-containing protein [Oscillospiraceae bacterium]
MSKNKRSGHGGHPAPKGGGAKSAKARPDAAARRGKNDIPERSRAAGAFDAAKSKAAYAVSAVTQKKGGAKSGARIDKSKRRSAAEAVTGAIYSSIALFRGESALSPEERRAMRDKARRERARQKRASAKAQREREAAGSSIGARTGRRLQHASSRFHTIVAENQKSNFPESDSLFIQAFLLVWGLLPCVGAFARERLSGLRHKWHELLLAIRFPHSEAMASKRAQIAMLLGAATVVMAVFLPLSIFTSGTTVSYEGTPLATVASRKEAQRIVAQMESTAREMLGEDYVLDERSIEYDASIVRRSEVSADADADALANGLSEELGLVYAYTLYVNDEKVGSTQYEGALEDLLEQMRTLYSSESTVSVEFLEQVRIEEGYLNKKDIVNLGHIVSKLNSTKAGEVTYTVQKGDTWGEIANSNGLSSSQLSAINPGYDINRLSIGEVLLISNAVPYLTVVVTEQQSYVADVQYDVSYEDDSSIYQGDYRVVSKGEYGAADVIANVTYVNGEEMEREIVSSVTLVEPVTEYRLRGTKERPSWMATGTFRWPTTGRITSYFGSRNTGIRGASTDHKGIDIANSYGTAIYAADGGRVTFAGWKSAMGYTVIINHDNGY